MLNLPVYHSVISSDALGPAVQNLYDLGDIINCRFLSNGLNDTYTLQTTTGTFMLRIYKANWRNKQDVLFEIEMLNHLIKKDIPVSGPVLSRDGKYFFELDAPDGVRSAVVFTYAEGARSGSKESYYLYGEQVAKMHLALDDFKCPHERFTLDLYHLLDKPIQSIRTSLSHRPKEMEYLVSLSQLLSNRINDISSNLEWGVCHGDLHGGNVHFYENSLTHFDFDCGGYGWRAYDVSVFLWGRVSGKEKDFFTNELWESFLESYLKCKELSEYDMNAINLFVAIREIWLMGLHTGNSQIWGGWQNDPYFDDRLKFLRNWCEAHSIQ